MFNPKPINIHKRSAKSQEAYADYLMKISVTLMTAFFVTILIVPIAAIVKSIFLPTSTSITLMDFLSVSFVIKSLIFLLCEFAVFYFSDICRDKALEIYDNLP